MVNAKYERICAYQTGNQLILEYCFRQIVFYDLLNLSVPGSIGNGTLHTYSISISSAEAFECDTSDNTDYLKMIVGNSYDPYVMKPSLLPEVIAPDIQDELRILSVSKIQELHLHKTYIDDTLSNHLDWINICTVKIVSSRWINRYRNGSSVSVWRYMAAWRYIQSGRKPGICIFQNQREKSTNGKELKSGRYGLYLFLTT